MESLKKVTPAHWIKNVKTGGRFAILTPDNPRNPAKQMSHEEMRARLNHLQKKGLISGFFKGVGVYDNPNERENSYVVVNPKDFSHITQLGSDAGQDSVLLSDNGKHQVARTNVTAQDPAPAIGQGYTGEGKPEQIQNFQPFSTRVKPRSASKATYTSVPANYGDTSKIEPVLKSEGNNNVTIIRRLLCILRNTSRANG